MVVMVLIDFINFFESIIDKFYIEGGMADWRAYIYRYGLTITEKEVSLYDFHNTVYFFGKPVNLLSTSNVATAEILSNKIWFPYYFEMSTIEWKFSISLCAYYFGMPNIDDELSENIFNFIQPTSHSQEKCSNRRDLKFSGNSEQFFIDLTMMKMYL